MQTLVEADQGRRVCHGASCRLRTQVKPLQHAEPPLRRPTIILVEDDLSLIGAMKFALQADGFDVLAYTDGRDLLTAKARRSADCMVVDHLVGLASDEPVQHLPLPVR